MPCMRTAVPGSMGELKSSRAVQVNRARHRCSLHSESVSSVPQDEFVWLADSPPIQTAEDLGPKNSIVLHEMVIGLEDLRRELRSTCFQSTIPEKRRAGSARLKVHCKLYRPSSGRAIIPLAVTLASDDYTGLALALQSGTSPYR
jgi:hypothetical protein